MNLNRYTIVSCTIVYRFLYHLRLEIMMKAVQKNNNILQPLNFRMRLKKDLKKGGILILNTRLGSGFDILTLKGSMDSIFPYEHIMLPSRRGLEMILDKAGYELLEITTPGTRDMESVLKNKERVEESNFFIKYLLKTADRSTLADFQKFLQKSGMSSFAQVVAKVRM